MSKLQKNIFVFGLAALGVWCLLMVPSVTEAFLNFCLMGQIPGTDRTLAPETVMRLALGTFAFIVLWSLRKKFFRRLFRPVMPEPVEAAELIEKAKAPRNKPVRPQQSAVIAVLPAARKTHSAKQRVRQWLGFGIGWLSYAVIWCADMLERGLRGLAYRLKQAWNWTLPHLYQAAQFTKQTLQQGWQKTEPYLRRFDQWLNITLHKSKRFTDLQEVALGCWRTVVAYGRKISSLLNSRD